MQFNLRKYNRLLAENDIDVIYSGQIRVNGIDGMAEMLLMYFEFDEVPLNTSQPVFSAFVEQMNNMLMYSTETEQEAGDDSKPQKASQGVYVIGIKNSTYFIQTGNTVTPESAENLKKRIDNLNAMDKKLLREHYKRQLKSDTDDPESAGGEPGDLGLTEIARRASGPIKYNFEPLDNGLIYFSMHVTISQEKKL